MENILKELILEHALVEDELEQSKVEFEFHRATWKKHYNHRQALERKAAYLSRMIKLSRALVEGTPVEGDA